MTGLTAAEQAELYLQQDADQRERERRNLVQLEVSHTEEERRREDDACKHAEQRSVEREEETPDA